MNQDNYGKLRELAMAEPMRSRTAAYLASHLAALVAPGDPVLICFQDVGEEGLSGLMKQAVKACGGRPVLWGRDRRWKTLLRLAFTSRAATIIGSPLLLLGLSKLKRANGTPLAIRNVVITGYPCFPWMIDGIVRGFDCREWGCFALGTSGLVAGFSCPKERNIHLWDQEYEMDVVDELGRLLPPGQEGRWAVYPKDHPELRWSTGEFGRLETAPCACGDPSPRIMDLRPSYPDDPEAADLAEYLLSWTSVLDCSLRRGPYGLEIELVTFPGEKLPKLPRRARQVVRPWDPSMDEPCRGFPVRNNAPDF